MTEWALLNEVLATYTSIVIELMVDPRNTRWKPEKLQDLRLRVPESKRKVMAISDGAWRNVLRTVKFHLLNPIVTSVELVKSLKGLDASSFERYIVNIKNENRKTSLPSRTKLEETVTQILQGIVEHGGRDTIIIKASIFCWRENPC